ncbi:sensor histidine kinase [Sneathiella litorea]|uniref:histidine kinase n=1 Tax=Sneathiella litorea TaxID=2606216 RepID=A0A6L8W5J0_9PROT|nr:sensor histidine kinase [Sneathiella litorea]MZR29734.1 HAMP domain-containing protein [Sneathiella litorea]
MNVDPKLHLGDSASDEKKSENPEKKVRRGPFSSLGRRIMAINLFSVVFLAGGILYLDQFRDGLIEARFQALTTNGRMIAGALGEAALQEVSLDGQVQYLTLDSLPIKRVLRRLSIITNTPALLFDREGVLIADSRRLISAGRNIVSEQLPPPEVKSPVRLFFEELYDGWEKLFPTKNDYPLFPTNPIPSAADFQEIGTAINGDNARMTRQTYKGELVLSVSVPVQGFKHILGGLLLTENGNSIDEAVRSAQVTTLIVFAVTLVITLLLSLFLARTIASPIHVLAEAADKVRRGIGRRMVIPDFSDRKDEIGDLSTSFRAMTSALYDRLDAIEAFAADVSHELKNPLTSLGTAVQAFERVKDEEIREKLRAVIVSDVNRLDRLITDISAASRLDAELSRAEGEPVDLIKLVEGVLDSYRTTQMFTPISFDFKRPDKAVKITGLPGRLGQVLRNLIDNAISFSPENGQVLIRLRNNDDTVEISIEDEGPGIPENKLDAIFSRFYTERPKAEGFGRHSGLGLSISRLIVEAHGGKITARNRLDDSGEIKGATFLIQLPK